MGSLGGACGEVGGCYGGEEYKNGETYDGFENGEMNYKSKGSCYNLEGEYAGSCFEDNTDLEHCQYPEKEEKVMMMVSMVTMVMMMMTMMVSSS